MLKFALTDIHGRYDLLIKALEAIEQYAGDREHKLIFLGDYVDRGPDSYKVIGALKAMQEAFPDTVVCLYGNHEDMMIRALLSKSSSNVKFWMENGGDATLKSYTDLGEGYEETVGTHLFWLNELPLYHIDGNHMFVHAGIDPYVKPEDQDGAVMIWTRSERFFTAPRADLSHYVVHGHSVTTKFGKEFNKVEVTESRTNLDTAACNTGILSVGVFDDTQEKPIDILTVTL